MDRIYYQLIEEAVDLTRLATAVHQYADYSAACKNKSDIVIKHTLRTMKSLRNSLEDILTWQQQAVLKLKKEELYG